MIKGAAGRKILMSIYDRLYKFFGPQGWWPGDTRLEMMVGAILTQNTAWTNVEKAIANLKKAKALTSARKLKNMDEGRLAALIRPSGYFNVKAKRLKNFAAFLCDEYGADLSRISRRETGRLRDELLSVNGVGPETCDSILLYAFKKPVFVVDAYTKRILSRHKLIDEKSDYSGIQKVFMDNLPEDQALFNEFHALIVRLGKELCRKSPRCGLCPLRELTNGALKAAAN